MHQTVKTVVFWIVIVVSASLLWQIVRSGRANPPSPEINYSTFIFKAQSGEIADVSITGARIEGKYRNDAGTFHLVGPNDPAAFLGILQDKGVEIRFREVPEANLPLQILGTWAPLILLGALWFFMVRQMQRRKASTGSGGGLNSSGTLG
jgi:cell division protease FtsH